MQFKWSFIKSLSYAKPEVNSIKKFESIFGKKVNIKTVTDENFDAALRTGVILIKEVIANHIVVCNPDPFTTMLWRQYIER